jgi:membrane-bound lytic murein transglycosylase D
MSFATRVLVLFSAINLVNYIDRYVVAAILEPLGADLSLNDAQRGRLTFVFVIVYMLAAPVFGALADRFHRPRLIAVGVTMEALHAEFEGDWLLALAAYNAGSGSVRRAVERNQRNGLPTDFFHLDLPAETRAYVPKLLAISRLVAEPGAFGVALPAIPNAPYFARVDLEHQVDLGKVADLAQIPRDELRALNPEFNRWATAPEGPHHLLVPVPAKERFETLLAALPQEARLRLAHHRVRRGDTLNAIARRHRVSVEALRGANGIRGSLIHPGQDLLVPLPYRVNV